MLRPAVGAMPQRVRLPPREDRERQRLKVREQNTEWRAWYKTKRWQQLRLAVFERDNWTCQRTGELCTGKHPADNSPVANHKVPHRGDPELFWDIDNIETVTKAVHDSIVQAEERAADGRNAAEV